MGLIGERVLNDPVPSMSEIDLGRQLFQKNRDFLTRFDALNDLFQIMVDNHFTDEDDLVRSLVWDPVLDYYLRLFGFRIERGIYLPETFEMVEVLSDVRHVIEAFHSISTSTVKAVYLEIPQRLVQDLVQKNELAMRIHDLLGLHDAEATLGQDEYWTKWGLVSPKINNMMVINPRYHLQCHLAMKKYGYEDYPLKELF